MDDEKTINQQLLVLLVDQNGSIVSINDNFLKASGYEFTDLIGQLHHVLLHPEMVETVVMDLEKTLSSGKTWEGYLKKLTKAGDSFWVRSSVCPNGSGGFLSCCHQVLEEEIEEISQLLTI